jgi:hypothetical protein
MEVRMRARNIIISVVIASGLCAPAAVAQHEEHRKAETAPTVGQADTGKTGDVMAGNMMSQTSRSMIGQDEIGELVEQLNASFAAIESEQNQASLQKKLAEHGKLIKELQTKVQAKSHMMEMMHQHMTGVAMTGGEAKGENKE